VWSSSMVISDISTNSRSSIFLTIFSGKEAAGLNVPVVSLEDSVALGGLSAAAAAAASRSSPDVGLPAGVGLGMPVGLKSGRIVTAS
jgi:hypothetical protein